MASFKDVLAVLITGDASQFVREVERAGGAAERNMAKADVASKRTGDAFIKTGAVMVGVGAVMAIGLGKAVSAAKESEIANLKLENSVSKMKGALPGAADRMRDYATAIQEHTVVTDEDALAVESQLATFGLTEGQIRTLLPLVVDLSEKSGKGLAPSALAVGKAVEGTAGGLKKMGIIVDDTAFATDHFGTVVDTLKGKVGGFAEAEGKTLEGRLTILGNKFGEFQESVGKGAVPVLEKLVTVAEAAGGALGFLDDASGGTVGQVAAVGTVALIAVGGVLLFTGAVQKAKLALAEMNVGGVNAGAAVGAAAKGFVVFSVAEGILGAARSAIDATTTSTEELRATTIKFGGDGEKALGAFLTAVQRDAGGTENLGDALFGGGFGDALNVIPFARKQIALLTGDTGEFTKAMKTQFGEIAKVSPSTAAAILDSLSKVEIDGKRIDQKVIASLRKKVDAEVKTRALSAVAAQKDAEMTRQAALASGDATQIEAALAKSIDDVNKARDAAATKTKTYADATFSAIDATFSLNDAQDTLTKDLADSSVSLTQVAKDLEAVTKAAGEKAAQDLGPSATAAEKVAASNAKEVETLLKLKAEYPQLAPIIDQWTGSLLGNIAASQQSQDTDAAAVLVLDGLKAKYPELGTQIDIIETKIRAKDATQKESSGTDAAAVLVLDGLKAKYPELGTQIDIIVGKIQGYNAQPLDSKNANVNVSGADDSRAKMEALNREMQIFRDANGSAYVDPRKYGGRNAKGGRVDTSHYYTVGEEGPEIFVPDTAGRIIPNTGPAPSPSTSAPVRTVDVQPSRVIAPAGDTYYVFNITALDARSVKELVFQGLTDHIKTNGQGPLKQLIGVTR